MRILLYSIMWLVGSFIILIVVGYFLTNTTSVEKCPTCQKDHFVERINDDTNVFRCNRCNYVFAVYLVRNPITKQVTKQSVEIAGRAAA